MTLSPRRNETGRASWIVPVGVILSVCLLTYLMEVGMNHAACRIEAERAGEPQPRFSLSSFGHLMTCGGPGFFAPFIH